MKSLLVIFIGAVVVLFMGLGKKENRSLPLVLGILILALGLVFYDLSSKVQWAFEAKYVPMSMLLFNYSALAFEGVLILACIFIVGLFSQKETVGTDLYGLILFSLCGGILLTAYTNLVMLFLGLEILSIPLFVLAGTKKSDLKSNEAAIKYFLMGAFSTVIFLLGCAFVYGATGKLDILSLNTEIGKLYMAYAHFGIHTSLATAGILLVIIGFCFKVAAVPFHFWSPDVYEGSPNRATVFMAVVVKIAAFAAFLRLLSIPFIEAKATWGPILAVISAITILVGNIGALRQTNVKRTLAYSSVAHSGYLILGLLAAPEDGMWAILMYSIAYAAGSSTIFYLFNRVSRGGDESFAAFNGFGKANTLGGLALIVAMFSLAGIPITAGFAGKYSLFSSVFSQYTWLVVVALLGSAISIGYYFRIFKNAFFVESDGVKMESTLLEKIMLSLVVASILVLGIMPWLIWQFQYIQF